MVSLVWKDPGMTMLANQAIVQHDGQMVYLTFGQANPPLILGETEEEKQRQLDEIQSVTVLPIIRLAMAPESFRAVIEILQTHLTKMGEMGPGGHETA
jgi:hypothetical protein